MEPKSRNSSPQRRGRSEKPGSRWNGVGNGDATSTASVRIQTRRPRSSSSSSSSTESSTSTTTVDIGEILKSKLAWIPENWTWPCLKPVIRCAIHAWVGALLFAIPKVQRWMGQGAFLILIASFLSPPNDPFISVLERELLILIFVGIAWAWSCLALALADLARTNHNPNATIVEVLDGRYIETGPSVIIGAFLGLGSVFFLYIKARQGPGPYLFASIFSCICLDITLTTAAFFPYPYYKLGLNIFLPLAIHTCISLATSVLVFPATISAQLTNRLRDVLTPLSSCLDMHRTLLQSIPGTEDFSERSEVLRKTTAKSESGLIAVAAAVRLLGNDFIFCRFSPEDFKPFQVLCRRLTGRAHGMVTYFGLIDPFRETFPTFSVPNTPAPGTPSIMSRAHSPERVDSGPPTPTLSVRNLPVTPAPSAMSFHMHSRSGSGQNLASGRHSHFGPHLLHQSLLNLSLRSRHRRNEYAVGVFESQRYLNLEAKKLYDPRHDENSAMSMALLRECCDGILEQCKVGVEAIEEWLDTVRDGRFTVFRRKEQRRRKQERVDRIAILRDDLSKALHEFRTELRMKVLDPYRPAFETTPTMTLDDDDDYHHHHDIPPHRHLFRCYVYQYHLIQFTEIVIESLDEILRLEKERGSAQLWTPVKHYFWWSPSDVPEGLEKDEDDDPDIIRGLPNVQADSDLGLAHRRDPDALPPRNWFEWFMYLVYKGFTQLWNGNCLFAIKAGIITTVLALPLLFQSSAAWSYSNRWAWALVMGQLTLARFRGDTTFGLLARIVATFGGGLVGMTMWYISTGSGNGSAYGLAIVCGVCFPFFFFVRLYWPIPPMTNMVAFVTAILVVGYSYQNTVMPQPGNPGFGWDVAWRRFVLVTVGVVAAFLASLLPPNMTLRLYQRHILSTTASEIGTIYCAIVSYAAENDQDKKASNVQPVVSSLVATRSRLNRSELLWTNIIYEFSLRGRWPKHRYKRVLDLQLAISFSLSHLMSVLKHLEPAWTRAFLRRARLLDPDFQGDVLAVITMISTSLRTGHPLPQITPCPLLDRFTMRNQGLDIIHRDSEEDFGLPRLLTMDTLMDEQYMIFCVGISTAFGIINRLDRLMLAVKEIVGEQYHLHGIGSGSGNGGGNYPLMSNLSRPSTKQFTPPAVNV
ncbi:hypothetical protein CC2G_002792 [Coprinopsis cinerea AmutBmut pab1-1]|nr:hypothetical protein CC2G_002792 [Coprinopsis cinerea AmutBmut pab1-1]